MLYDDADMERAGRFDSLGMTGEDAGVRILERSINTGASAGTT